MIQEICQVVSDVAIYLTSVEDNAIVFHHLVDHETGELVRNKTYLVMDFQSSGLTAQSLFIYPKKPLWFAPSKYKARFLVVPGYHMMYRA